MTHRNTISARKAPLRAGFAAAGLAMIVGAPALADPPHCPPGHERQGRCVSGDRHDARDTAARAYEQGYRDGQRDAWRVGDRFDREEYVVIRDYGPRGLTPPPHGHYYVQVDEQVLMVEAATRLVTELVNR